MGRVLLNSIISKILNKFDGFIDFTVNGHKWVKTTDGKTHSVRAIAVRKSKKLVFICDAPITTHFLEECNLAEGELERFFNEVLN